MAIGDVAPHGVESSGLAGVTERAQRRDPHLVVPRVAIELGAQEGDGGRRSEAGERRDRRRHHVAVGIALDQRAQSLAGVARAEVRGRQHRSFANAIVGIGVGALDQLQGARSDADSADETSGFGPHSPEPVAAERRVERSGGLRRRRELASQSSQSAQRRRQRRRAAPAPPDRPRRDRGGSRAIRSPHGSTTTSFGFSSTARRCFSFACSIHSVSSRVPADVVIARVTGTLNRSWPSTIGLHLSDLDVEQLAVGKVAMLDFEDGVPAAVDPVGEEPVEVLAGRFLDRALEVVGGDRAALVLVEIGPESGEEPLIAEDAAQEVQHGGAFEIGVLVVVDVVGSVEALPP